MKITRSRSFKLQILAKCLFVFMLYSCKDDALVQNSYLLNLTVNPPNSGEVTGGGYYNNGALVAITATPNQEYEFLNWTNENNEVISSNAVFIYTILPQNRSLTANFKLDTFSFTPTSAPRGQTVTISFSGGSNFTFTQASNTCPEIFANALLYLNQASPTTIYPNNIYFHNSKSFDAVFDIPSGVTTGHYNLTIGHDTQCSHTESSAFEIY